MKRQLIQLTTCLALCACVFSFDIDKKRGMWKGLDAKKYHYFDNKLSQKLGDFFRGEGAETLVDFGCGMGNYTHAFQQMGFDCEAYDGNPDTEALTGGIGKVLDLSKKAELNKQFDWVMSLEVGEHIPAEFETVFIENLVRHAKDGIVLSWALKGQTGAGHFNTQNNDYIKARFKKYGFVSDDVAEKLLRRYCDLHWFRGTLMVFRRVKK